MDEERIFLVRKNEAGDYSVFDEDENPDPQFKEFRICRDEDTGHWKVYVLREDYWTTCDRKKDAIEEVKSLMGWKFVKLLEEAQAD